MRRPNWKTVSTLATLVVLAGCQEHVLAPSSAPSAAPASVQLAPLGHPQLSLSGGATSITSADFTVTPYGGAFLVGNHAVVFPSRSICDPETSAYGAEHWDEPCLPLKTSVSIHAELRRDGFGNSWVDFSPALRFVPSDNPSRWVWVLMYSPAAIGATADLARFNVLYARSIGGETIDEALIDSTMRTYVDTRSGVSLRRVKHFSGFMTSSGRACDPATESDCIASDGP